MPALVFLRRTVGGCGVCVAQTYTWMRSQLIKPHTSARRALPLARVSYPLRLLFNAVNVLLHDGCRLRDFLALLELPALLPDLLIDLRKLLIEIRFFCQQGFA